MGITLIDNQVFEHPADQWAGNILRPARTIQVYVYDLGEVTDYVRTTVRVALSQAHEDGAWLGGWVTVTQKCQPGVGWWTSMDPATRRRAVDRVLAKHQPWRRQGRAEPVLHGGPAGTWQHRYNIAPLVSTVETDPHRKG